MDVNISLVFLGGVISLISTITGIVLQHIVSMKRFLAETRQHPFRVIYNKQTEFFDKLAPILLDLNAYISTVNYWLEETALDAADRAKETALQNQPVGKFDILLQHYYMYIPHRLLEEANQLHEECFSLYSNPKTSDTIKCLELLFSFQNSIREHVGIERLSEDFFKAFAKKKIKVEDN